VGSGGIRERKRESLRAEEPKQGSSGQENLNKLVQAEKTLENQSFP